MKIYNNKIEQALKVYKKNEIAKQDNGSSKITKKDQYKMSEKAKDFQIAMKALNNVPDVRQDKVDEISRQIQTGTYKVDSGKIAEKIFESVKFDQKV